LTYPRDKGKKSTPEFKNLRLKFRSGLVLASEWAKRHSMSKSFLKKVAPDVAAVYDRRNFCSPRPQVARGNALAEISTLS
jgi:hypothetical protein